MNYDDFEALTPEEQQKIILESPVRDKGDLILHAHEPGALTRSLAAEELYLVSREMDPEERSELIRHATLPQLFFIADLDCWIKDQISPEGFVSWLETLRLADENKLYAWLHETDYESIVAAFQKFVRVLKPEWEYAVDEQLGDQPYFTLDQMYFIAVDEQNFDTVKRAFEVLFENHRGRYTAVLEGIIGESGYEVEEEAYRFREGRLADRGFPDYETAIRIYAPLSRQAFEKFEHKKKEAILNRVSAGENARPTYLVLRSAEQLFLDKVLPVLGHKDEVLLEGVYEELAWLCNKLIVCHGMDFTSEEKVKWTIERARGLLSLGLEMLSKGNLQTAVVILEERWIETIFRFGAGELYLLRERAEALVKRHWGEDQDKALLSFLDPPYEFIVRGLLERVPLFYDFTVTENIYSLREFRGEEDLRRAALSLRQIEIIHKFFQSKAPGLFKQAADEFAFGQVSGTLFPVLGTLFANFVLRGKPSLESLSGEDVTGFLVKAFEVKEQFRMLKTEFKEDFLHKYFGEEEQELLRSLWGLIFQKIQEQMTRLDPEEKIELPFLTALLVRYQEPSAAPALHEKKAKPANTKTRKPRKGA